MIKVESICPHCGATFEIDATFLGLYHVKCLHCDRIFPAKVQFKQEQTKEYAETLVGVRHGTTVWQYTRKVKL